jgi:hypothetical protein
VDLLLGELVLELGEGEVVEQQLGVEEEASVEGLLVVPFHRSLEDLEVGLGASLVVLLTRTRSRLVVDLEEVEVVQLVVEEVLQEHHLQPIKLQAST